MSLGPASRPKEPLHVGTMLLALILAALLGGAGGLIYHWLTGDENASTEDASSADPEEEASATPTPAPTIAPPRPSPGS